MNEDHNIKLRFVILSCFLIIVGAILLFYGFKQSDAPQKSVEIAGVQATVTPILATSSAEIKGEEFTVTRVVDGDTIVISSGEKVRYIGIDTPETVDPRRAVGCFGKEASDENKKLVEGKSVILTKDISETDKFGRPLRLVYLKQDDGSLVFVNDYLVREGFAKASTYPPDVKFAAQFLTAEKEARDNQRGLWKMCL